MSAPLPRRLRWLLSVVALLGWWLQAGYAQAQPPATTPCQQRWAAIHVGALDVKAFVYCLDGGQSVPLSAPLRAPLRTGTADGLQDGIIPVDQLGQLTRQVLALWQELLDPAGPHALDSRRIRVVLSSATEATRNVDGLIQRLRAQRIPDPQIALVSTYEEAAYGLLDALNLAAPAPNATCPRVSDIEQVIFVKIGTESTHLAYFDDGEFHTLNLNLPRSALQAAAPVPAPAPAPASAASAVAAAATSAPAGRAPPPLSREALRRLLDTRLDRAQLLQTHRALFDLQRRPVLLMTGGTVWAATRIAAAADPTPASPLRQQVYGTSRGCYMQLGRGSFARTISALETLRPEPDPLRRYHALVSRYLTPWLQERTSSPWWSAAERATDLDNLLAAYGYRQDELIAQAVQADWLLDMLGRQDCQGTPEHPCQVLYMNQQDNWGRLHEYRQHLPQSLGSSHSLADQRIAAVKRYGETPPRLSYRSKDMLR